MPRLRAGPSVSCCGRCWQERCPIRMWTPLPSSGEWATTVCSCLCLIAVQTASNCSWGNAGEWAAGEEAERGMKGRSWGIDSSQTRYFTKEGTNKKGVKVIFFHVPVICEEKCVYIFHRNCKPRNRPSFRQILLHLDIASADILSTPQETYFQSQVSFFCPSSDSIFCDSLVVSKCNRKKLMFYFWLFISTNSDYREITQKIMNEVKN